MKKVISVILTVLLFAAVFTGCGNSTKENNGLKTTNSQKKSYDLKIKDIDWSVEEGIIDGERGVLISITNNSDYTFSDVVFKFKEKSDTSEETKNSVFSYLADVSESSIEEVKEYANNEFYISAKTSLIKKSESKTFRLMYFDGVLPVNNYDHYILVEPDILSLEYIKDGKINKGYYDFINSKWSFENGSEDAYYWTTSSLGNIVPKPDVERVKKYLYDDENNFGFEFNGESLSDFSDYVEACKQKGFNDISTNGESAFMAKNENGFKISAMYYKNDNSIKVILNAPNE